ncbi:MAG: response regulator transcription factor [Propionibacteriaceae bacterium]|nr:response regulator transcription factor [Propionibacteriaceae bacterium]
MRVLIVDDNPVVRAGLRAKLTQMQLVDEIVEAADGLEALETLAREQFDVVLLDVHMPRMDGLTALKRMNGVRVVMLTNSEDEDVMREAVSAGAVGYLTFSKLTDAGLEAALITATEGGFILSSAVVNTIPPSASLLRPPPVSSDEKVQQFGLSTREGEVMQGLSRGLSNERIAVWLGISPRTVRNHLFSIYTKMGVGSRGEAVAVWLGIEDTPPPATSNQR